MSFNNRFDLRRNYLGIDGIRRSAWTLTICLALALLFASAGSAQTISNLNPNTATAGTPGVTIVITGTFIPSLNPTVNWTFNSTTTTLTTSLITTTEIDASVPASLLLNSGVAGVTVTQLSSNSNSVPFIITDALALTSISPTTATAGGPAFTLTANGAGFTPSTTITWNGSSLTTTFVNSGQLTAIVPATLIASPATNFVTVSQPGQESPGGFNFVVQTTYSITSLDPSSTLAGGPDFTITVHGTGFLDDTFVTWNGTIINTVQIDGNTLTATVPAALIATPGTAAVSVTEMTLGSLPPLTFTILSPLTLTSINPNSAVAGGPGFTLTANGSGYTNATSITWNGTPLTTSFVSSNQLTATIPASLINSPGAASVNVAGPGQASPSPLTFTIVSPPFTITSMNPTSATAGGPTFTLTVNGSGFNAVTSVTWNNIVLNTTFVNAGQLTAQVPANLIASPGTANVTVSLSGQNSPPPLIFTINPAAPTLTSINPNTAVSGGPTFTLTANGSGYTNATSITWNGNALSTTFVNAGQLTATVPANLIATAGTAAVTVLQSGQPSPPALTFTITQAPLTLTSISPNTAVSGGPAFTLTANGGGFTNAASITWNGSPLTTTFVNAGQLTATVPANLIATAGTAQVTVASSGQTSPASLTFTITQAPLTLTSISPNTAISGGPAFTLTANGGGFTNAASITWNGSPLTTTFVNAGQLTATVPANLIATAGTAQVTVASSGQTSPASLTFTITQAPLTLTSISPNSAASGGPSFTLTANGGGFTNATVITWQGTALATTFVSVAQLTATVPASFIASANTVPVTVSESGRTSPGALGFTITQSPLSLTSISPNTAVSGGPAFTLTANGGGFTNAASITWNGSPLTTTFVNAGQLTATVPANLIAAAGTAQVSVASSGQTPPAPLTFTITQASLTLTSISPNSAASGGPGFTLTANGGGFTNGTVVTWNGAPLATTFVSVAQLTATVPANLIASAGTASVTVSESSRISPPALTFTINQSPLTLTSISPNTAVSGSPAFTLTANGGGYTNAASITWNGSPLTTTFVNAGQLTATVPANLIATAGTASVSVASSGLTPPSPLTFTITQAPLTLTSISPNTAVSGGPAFTLTANGGGYTNATSITWNGTPLTTTFVNVGQLTATVPANLIATAGTAQVSVASSGQTSPASLTFTITQATPTLISISPNSATAGDPGFTLTANGTAFTSSSAITWNGTALKTSFVSAAQITALIPASFIATPGTASVAVLTLGVPASAPLTFTILTPLVLTSISPSAGQAGGPAFTLTANGSGYNNATSITWNGTALTTTFVSSVQLTASVPANLIAIAGTASVSLAAPGLPSPTPLPFTINGPLTLTSITPNSASAGGPAFSLTANGAGYTPATVITWNGTPLNTLYASTTQVIAMVPANLIVNPGTASVGVTAPGQTSPQPLTFTINGPLTLTSITPNTTAAGGPAFTLTANGAGYTASTSITWNGTPLTTSFVSSGQLTATIPANLIATAGTASVGVTAPGQPSPSPLNFTITTGTLTLTSITPNSTGAGGPDFTLTANGSGYTAATTVTWNGTPLITSFVSASQLTATVPASLIATAGTASVTVALSGQTSPAPQTFTITPNSMTLTSLAPNSAVAGGPAFTLTVNGSGFTATTSITWNGTPLTTSFVSASQLTANIPANLIVSPSAASVTVAATGQTSPAPLTFTITQTPLTLTSLSPNTTVAGSPAFTLTVNGTNFVTGTSVTWNGILLQTAFVSPLQLTATVPASLLLSAGTAAVNITTQPQPASLTFTITPVVSNLILSSLSPNTAAAGSGSLTLTVNGSGFFSGVGVFWNAMALPTNFVNANQLIATVPANLLASAGTASVNVQSGAQSSNSLPFIITSSTNLTLSSLSPSSVGAGAASFNMSVFGSGFASGNTVTWNGSALSTSFVSTNQLTAFVPSTLVATAGTAFVNVSAAGANSPASLPFTITGTGGIHLSLTSVTPGSLPAGGPSTSLLVDGSGFDSGTTIFWNNIALPGSLQNGNQITVTVAANLIAQPGVATITAQESGQVSNAIAFNITAAQLTLSSITPNGALAGGPAFVLTANGSGFTPGTSVTWNGVSLSTSFVSTTQITAAVPAAFIAKTGTASVSVAAPSLISPAPLPFIINQTLILTSLSPTSTLAGGPDFTLTVNGAGLGASATVFWNAIPLSAVSVAANQMTLNVPASLISQPGVASISAQSGSENSNILTFNVVNQGLTLTGLSPSSAPAGGPSFSLIVNGGGFTAGTTVYWNNTALTTSFVSLTQVNASIPANLIAQAGTASITAANGPLVSNALTFTIGPPGPAITSLSPSSAVAGGPSFTLTVNGGGFLATSGVTWNNSNLTTTFVSATQLTAAVPAGLISQIGTAVVVVANGSVLSNSASFAITPPAPVITSLSPSTFTLGGASFTVTINGSGFQDGAAATLGATALATTFVSATQLTALIPASLLTQSGSFPVIVTNPTGPPSNAMNIVASGLTPTITSVVPPTIGPGDTITVTGTNFVPGSTVYLGTTPLPTTYVDSTHVTATLPPVTPPGTLPITVVNPGAPASNPAPVVVTPSVPTITTTSPTTVPLGGPAFTLTVTGSNFVAGATVFLGSAALPTTFVSPTQVTAAVPANLILQPGPIQVTVTNPGTAPSNPAPFTVVPPAPTLTSVSPNPLIAGGPAVTITVTGTNFLSGATVYLNGTALVTSFVSATQVTAQVTADLIAQVGPTQITVANVSGPQSPALVLNVAPPVVTISSLSRSSATAGDPAFTLTVNGTGFEAGALVNFGTNTLATTFVSSTQLSAQVTANLLLLPNTFQVVVQQPGQASNQVAFAVNLPAPPSLRLGAPITSLATQQPVIDFGLNAPYPIPLTATVTITFASNASTPTDDPTIQFSGGGRTMTFTIPANVTTAPTLQLQTGTTAGVITLTVKLTAAGIDVTPPNNTTTVTIAKSAPVILSGGVKLIRNGLSIEVDITGYSTTREVTQAVFHFNASSATAQVPADVTVPLTSIFNTWYQSAASLVSGTQFTYAQPFTVTGDPSQIASVTVTLTNSVGNSQPMTSN